MTFLSGFFSSFIPRLQKRRVPVQAEYYFEVLVLNWLGFSLPVASSQVFHVGAGKPADGGPSPASLEA